MRAFRFLCAGFLLVTVVQALPADPKAVDNKKIGRVELERDAEEVPVPDLPQDPIIFDGFLGSIGELFERMRQQMLYLMSHVPRIGLGTPEGGNTTSVTKVIDGHKVTINETVYTSGDGDDAAAIFKVRVVDIHPDSSEGSSEEVAPGRGSVESVEISRENEIPSGGKQQKRRVGSMEYLDDEPNYNDLKAVDEIDNLETFDEMPGNIIPGSIESFDEVEDEIDNKLEENEKDLRNDIEITLPNIQPPRDLSRDTYINDIAGNHGREPHPDVEIFYPYKPMRHYNIEDLPKDLSRDTVINDIARNQGKEPNADAEVFDPFNPPRDLSRDTYINDIARNQGRTPNPDAEFINLAQPMRHYNEINFERDSFRRGNHPKPHKDLSGDTYINDIARDQGMQPNPDAEVFDPAQPIRHFNEINMANPALTPPRDLSGDIYVNDMARIEGRQPNPDAEVFDPSQPRHHNVFNLARDTILNEIGSSEENFLHSDPRNPYFYKRE